MNEEKLIFVNKRLEKIFLEQKNYIFYSNLEDQ